MADSFWLLPIGPRSLKLQKTVPEEEAGGTEAGSTKGT